MDQRILGGTAEKGVHTAYTHLPESVDALKVLVLDKSAEAARYKARLEALEEQIRLMRHKQFGARSEKASVKQSNLFNEAELEALDAEDEDQFPVEEVVPPTSATKKSGPVDARCYRQSYPAFGSSMIWMMPIKSVPVVAVRLLAGYRGYVQTDGHSAYQKLGREIIQIGCWAHARRKFDEAVKSQPKGKSSVKAQMGLSQIQKLYAIEKQIANKPAEERQRIRQELAKAVIEILQAWLRKSLTEVPHTSKTGKALVYLKNQWPSRLHYLEDGRLNIDNNPAKNAIMPFVLVR